MNRLLGILIPALLLGAAAPALADDVYLANGQVFEDVIARRAGDQVRIRMAHGEMGFPASWVVKIEESETVLEEYLRHRAALEPGAGADGGGSAAEWLALARWARSRGFSEGAREAGLRAAARDPHLEGLAPILQAAGLVFDGESEAWLTEETLMLRRGYVRVGKEWLPAVVVAERERVAEEARLAAARSARETRLDQVITLLALAQLEEAREGRESVTVVPAYGGPVLGAPVAVFPGTFHPPRPHPRPPHRHPPHPDPPDAHHNSFSYEALAGRQPGSIIPLSADPGAARTRRD